MNVSFDFTASSQKTVEQLRAELERAVRENARVKAKIDDGNRQPCGNITITIDDDEPVQNMEEEKKARKKSRWLSVLGLFVLGLIGGSGRPPFSSYTPS